jgi:hypothetical protein
MEEGLTNGFNVCTFPIALLCHPCVDDNLLIVVKVVKDVVSWCQVITMKRMWN